MRRPAPVVRTLATLALLVVASVALAPAAAAHATVVGTSPEPGSVLDAPPAEVSITFDEPVSSDPDSLRVIDTSGRQVSADAEAAGATIRAALPDDAEGWFAVSWQIVSEDGHPLTGGWTYRVGEGADRAPDDLLDLAEGAEPPSSTRLAWGVAQWASALAALVLTGTGLVVALGPAIASQRRLVLAATVVGVAASFLAAGLNGPQTAVGTAWFDGPASIEHLARAGLLTVAGAALWWSWELPARWLRPYAASLAAAGLCVTVLSGHARAAGPAVAIVVMVHLLVAAAWLGSLPAVLLAAWPGGDGARDALVSFSRRATVLAGLVVVAGGAAAWMLSGGPSTIAPRWGAVLFIKIALVAVAVFAGGWTRFDVLRHWTRRTLTQIRTPLSIEVGLLALVVVASIALGHNGPPEEPTLAAQFQIQTTQDDVVVTLVLDPGRLGTNDIHLYVTDPAGLPLDVEEATVRLGSTELGVAPIEQVLSDLGGGHFSGRTDDIGAPGTWEVQVVVRPTQFTQVLLDGTLEVG